MSYKYKVRQDGYYSSVEPSTADDAVSFAEAKKQLVKELREYRDFYADALRNARKLDQAELDAEYADDPVLNRK